MAKEHVWNALDVLTLRIDVFSVFEKWNGCGTWITIKFWCEHLSNAILTHLVYVLV